MITIPRDWIISHSLRQGPSQSFVMCSSCEKDKHTAHWGRWAREGRQRLNLWQETGQWPEDLFHTPSPIVWYSRLGSEGCVVWRKRFTSGEKNHNNVLSTLAPSWSARPSDVSLPTVDLLKAVRGRPSPHPAKPPSLSLTNMHPQ